MNRKYLHLSNILITCATNVALPNANKQLEPSAAWSESKLKTDYSLLYNCIKTVVNFMTALSISNSHIHKKSPGPVTCFSAESTQARLVLWIIWRLLHILQMVPRAHAALSRPFHPWCFRKQSFCSLFRYLVYLGNNLSLIAFVICQLRPC